MSTTTVPAPAGSWLRADTGDDTVAVAELPVIGTTARVAVWPPARLGPALAAVDRVVADLDHQASRFRPDSEIAWIHDRWGGLFMLSDGLAGLMGESGFGDVKFTLMAGTIVALHTGTAE